VALPEEDEERRLTIDTAKKATTFQRSAVAPVRDLGSEVFQSWSSSISATAQE
jgi:hypothetical protein